MKRFGLIMMFFLIFSCKSDSINNCDSYYKKSNDINLIAKYDSVNYYIDLALSCDSNNVIYLDRKIDISLQLEDYRTALFYSNKRCSLDDYYSILSITHASILLKLDCLEIAEMTLLELSNIESEKWRRGRGYGYSDGISKILSSNYIHGKDSALSVLRICSSIYSDKDSSGYNIFEYYEELIQNYSKEDVLYIYSGMLNSN